MNYTRNLTPPPLPSQNRNNISSILLKYGFKNEPALPGKPNSIDKNSFSNRDFTLKVNNNNIAISFNNMCSYFNQFLNDLKDYNLIFKVSSQKGFNTLAKALQTVKRNKPVCINMIFDIPVNHVLDFESLPDYAYVSPLGYVDNQESDIAINTANPESFALWMGWLSDKDYNTVINKLTPKSKEYYETLNKIQRAFYNELKGKNLTDKEKTDIVYDYIKKHINYAKVTNSDGTLNTNNPNAHKAQDPVWTWNNKTGVCEGQAKLMVLLLNNKYQRVNITTESGLVKRPRPLPDLAHIWSRLRTDSGDYRYDTTLGKKAVSKDSLLRSGYIVFDDDHYQNVLSVKNYELIKKLKGRYI